MLCGNPVDTANGLVSCGRCMNCRINKRRMWAGRILLEAGEYKHRSSFITMTYDDDHLVGGSVSPGGVLVKRHVQNYMQGLRNGPIGKVRYYAAGEYGDKTKRAHYHAMLFGVDPYGFEEEIKKKWPHGNVHVGECTPKSAAYAAGYATKKMGDWEREGKPGPEFHISSKNPPLGAASVQRIRDLMYGRHGAATLEKIGDVPNSVRIQGKMYPLGKYWIQRMRDEVFLGEYKPSGTPKHEWCINYDEEKARSDELARQQAAAINRKRFARRNANSRTL